MGFLPGILLERSAFIGVCFLVRAMEGMGASMYLTTAHCYVAYVFAEDLNVVMVSVMMMCYMAGVS
jgi:hypothetical protein